ncbi:MAG: phage tail protein [Acidobacteria bacterium]|nr:phage tail protein [Acidobacteriota bacterium]
MPTYKTPGVYTEEISKLPPSVAEVATAIPSFIGYTEKAERFGQNLKNVPTRLKSLLEYQEIFGGGFVVPNFDVILDETNGYAVNRVTPTKRFYMYDAIQMYFDNGGGPCYVVSVGSYSDSVSIGNEATPATTPGLRVGLKAVEKCDEPTILLFPDAPLLPASADFYSIQQRALDQAARLMDRVAVLDLNEQPKPPPTVPPIDFNAVVQEFRDTIGINNLKYGAAYTPWLFSAYPKTVPFSSFNGGDGTPRVKDKAATVVDLTNLPIDPRLNALVSAANIAIADRAAIETKIDALRKTTTPAFTYATIADRYGKVRRAVTQTSDANAKTNIVALITLAREIAVNIATWRAAVNNPELRRDIDTMAKDRVGPAVTSLIKLEKNDSVQNQFDPVRTDTQVDTDYAGYDGLGWLAGPVSGIAQSTRDYSKDESVTPAVSLTAAATANQIAKDVDKVVDDLLAFIDAVRAAASTRRDLAEKTLYGEHKVIRNIVDAIKKELSRVPPSGAVAGVYAMVDRTRGVWKAPANVSLASVVAPTQAIDYYDQEDLNVDVNGGKSINAIRAFTGAGTLIWGARTLAGNDNEWRYVPVRRFFNMVEESLKKSTAWAVFEPNDANLWTKVKGMIDNYLIQKWRDGALVGATADKAFFTHVGLGITMTPQDILEGRLIIEVGMAVVRPAEFIILRFSHKMQEV